MHKPFGLGKWWGALERNESALFNAAAVAMTPNWNTVALTYTQNTHTVFRTQISVCIDQMGIR